MHKTIITTFLTTILVSQIFCAVADPISDRITVTVRGKGPDVLLIPGLACSNAVWDATAKHLESNFRLHIVQVAGFAGAPARANANGSVVQPTVDALDAYIKANKLKSPKIIGHSLGGFMGLMLASQHPEDVGKLLVVDSLPFFSVLLGSPDVATAKPQAEAMRDEIAKQSAKDFAKSESDTLHILVKSPEGFEKAKAWAIASDRAVIAEAMYELMTTDLRPKLAGIKTPVTMLYPFDSSSGFPQTAVDGIYQQNYASLPNKTLVRIEGSYHFIMFDQPEKFAAQVDAFVK